MNFLGDWGTDKVTERGGIYVINLPPHSAPPMGTNRFRTDEPIFNLFWSLFWYEGFDKKMNPLFEIPSH